MDNFVRLDKRDPIVPELDEKVEQLIAAEDSSIGFAAPDPFEQLNVNHYVVNYRKKCQLDELTVKDMYAALATFNVPDNVLHRVRVAALMMKGRLPTRVMNCMTTCKRRLSTRVVGTP